MPELEVGDQDAARTNEGDALSKGDLVQGHVDLVDPSGVHHPTTNGWWGSDRAVGEDPEALSSRITVHDGEFQVRYFRSQKINTEIAELDGRLAWFDTSWVKVPETGPLILTAHWAESVELDVVDKSSGAELDDVSVLRSEFEKFFDDVHPGDRRGTVPIFEHARSPIGLRVVPVGRSVRWSEAVWIGARDHAWQRLEVDYQMGGKQRCELAAGADLEVRFTGVLPEHAGPESTSRETGWFRESKLPRVRVRTPVKQISEDDQVAAVVAEARRNLAKMRDDQLPGHHRPTEDELLAKAKEWVASKRDSMKPGEIVSDASLVLDSPMELRGLPAGEWLVTVETGRADDHPTVLGSSCAQLTAGKRTTVTIALSPARSPTAAQKVPLAGFIEQSPAWGSNVTDLEFTYAAPESSSDEESFKLRRGQVQTDPTHPGLFAFDLGLVNAGRYVVRAFSRGVEQVVDTGTSGNRDVRIVIGDPADLILRPIDAKTRAPFSFPGPKVPQLSWEASPQTNLRAGKVQYAEWDQAIGAWRLHSAAGEITVILQSTEFDGYSRIILDAGGNEASFPIEPMCGVVIHFEVDGQRVAEPAGLWSKIQVMPLDGTIITAHQLGSSEKGTTIALDESVEVEISFPEIPAFERPESFRASVGRGQWVEHVVKLVRRQ